MYYTIFCINVLASKSMENFIPIISSMFVCVVNQFNSNFVKVPILEHINIITKAKLIWHYIQPIIINKC